MKNKQITLSAIITGCLLFNGLTPPHGVVVKRRNREKASFPRFRRF